MPVTSTSPAVVVPPAPDTGGPAGSGPAGNAAGAEGTAPAGSRTDRSAVASERARPAAIRPRRGALFVGAALSLEAAWVHLWLMPQAFFDWWGFGAFFLGVGLAQAALAVALLVRPAALMVLGGLVGNLVVVTTYVLSRTTYMPAGPHAGSPETVGVLGTATTVAELALIAVLISLLSGATRRWTVNLLLLFGAGLWALRTSEMLM